MALRCISQTALAATTETSIVDGTQKGPILIKSLVVCNRDVASDRYRIRLRLGNEGVADKQFLAYDRGITGNEIAVLPMEVGMTAGDVLTAYSGLANLSISVFAEEQT